MATLPSAHPHIVFKYKLLFYMTEEYKKFVSAYVNCYQNNKSSDKLSKLFNAIKDMDCNDFRLYFFKASYFNKRAKYDKAKTNIDKSINLLCNLNISDVICENGINLWLDDYTGKITTVQLFHINRQKIEVYSTAGEIYANLGKTEEALSFYKKLQYYTILLKSEFDEDCISLFSFRKFNQYTLSDLIENKITVSPSKFMNDPFDSLINLWANKDNLAQKCKDKSHAQPYTKSFNYFRIRSFCCGYDNEVVKKSLMWSHYAEEHMGFCIKYNLSSRFIKQEENDEFEHSYLKKIKYTKETINIDTSTIDTNLAFATKSSEWSYENEVRLIDYNPNIESPYYGIKLDALSYIDAIYFGYRCENQTISTIKALFNNNENHPNFFKMKLNVNDVYNMDIIKI